MRINLLEMCVICGFVHRDDRTQTRQRKPHYHWMPETGEILIQGISVSATVCVACLQVPITWSEYAKAREHTSDKFYIFNSYNATLPFLPTDLLTSQYQELCAALKIDSARWVF